MEFLLKSSSGDHNNYINLRVGTKTPLNICECFPQVINDSSLMRARVGDVGGEGLLCSENNWRFPHLREYGKHGKLSVVVLSFILGIYLIVEKVRDRTFGLQ